MKIELRKLFNKLKNVRFKGGGRLNLSIYSKLIKNKIISIDSSDSSGSGGEHYFPIIDPLTFVNIRFKRIIPGKGSIYTFDFTFQAISFLANAGAFFYFTDMIYDELDEEFAYNNPCYIVAINNANNEIHYGNLFTNNGELKFFIKDLEVEAGPFSICYINHPIYIKEYD